MAHRAITAAVVTIALFMEALVQAQEYWTQGSFQNSSGLAHGLKQGTLAERCQMVKDFDFVGNDFMSVKSSRDACCSECRLQTDIAQLIGTPACGEATWTDYQGGTCWMKKKGSPVTYKPGAYSYLHDYVNVDYISSDNCDSPGNDIPSSPRSKPIDCVTDCFNKANCRAVTWSNYKGGTCWFKTAFAGCVSAPGMTTFIVFKY